MKFMWNAVKPKLQDILARASKLKLDVLLGKTAFVLGIIGGGGSMAGFIPGKLGVTAVTICLIAKALTPRIQHASGLVTAAYAGQTPLIKIVPELIATLFSAPSLAREAKADIAIAEAQQAKDQAEQDKAEQIEATALKVVDLLKTAGLQAGTSSDNLSEAVPADLKAALDKALPPSETLAEPAPSGLTSVVTVGDKTL